tara:strand:- start:297 stop:770 length:474 start_codon:yes stop_codon:yes gene_type:complete
MKKETKERAIIKAIGHICNLNENDIKRNEKARRTSQLVQARQMFSYLLWDEFDYTFFEIRDAIGYRNHASAIHSKKMHEIDYFHDKRYREMYDGIIKKLNIKTKESDTNTEKENLVNEIKLLKKRIDFYKKELSIERNKREKYQQELITFRKKYIPS